MTVADKILFTCSACQYRARIPTHYSGRSIHCPGCKTIQAVAAIEEPGVPRSAPVAKLDTPTGGHAVLTTGTPGANKIVFACSACSYKGRLAAAYDGKTIRCPGCQTAQVVKGTPAPAPIVASMAADETAFRGGDSDKIRFGCSACGYRARIPSKYADKPIHCPQCKQIQVAKAETDLEEATGRTVSISRVTPAAVKEPRLAMTNVGVQFHCAVCGFESRISPSCAGDAIYCPSCRAPQKVEWGDPAAATDATDSAPAAAPASAAAALDDLPVPALDLDRALPAAGSDGHAVEAPTGKDGTDLFAVLLPVALVPAPAATVAKIGSRRIISLSGGPETPAPASPSSPAPEPAAAAPVARGRRSGPLPAKAEGNGSSSALRAVAADASGARAISDPASAPAKASKLPVILLAVVVLGLIVVSGFLVVQISDLKEGQTRLQQEAVQAQAKAAEQAQLASEQLAAQKAVAEKAQQEAEKAQQEAEKAQQEAEKAQQETEIAQREVLATKLAADAVRAELEALKAAAPAVDPSAVPAPPAGPAPLQPAPPSVLRRP